ncbi:succinate dehydrogenase, hydrophobic membrane anchor protein [Paracoccaceae bacterium GXU_MW_L88]
MGFQTDKARVDGLGSAHEGAGHWWVQRVTAVALVPLSLLFLCSFGSTLGEDFSVARATFDNLWNAIVAILFFGIAAYHLKMGVQEVLMDYVSNKSTLVVSLLANTLICGLLGATAILSVILIALG